MTWEEFCEKAKEMGAYVGKDLIMFDGKMFWSFGLVEFLHDDLVFARNRTPNQMYQIMKALK